MLRARVIPVLLLQGRRLVKGVKFRKHVYVGDPINIVKIFNEKEVDELVFMDIQATEFGKGPNYDFLKDILSEAFIPVAYGGGVSSLDQAKRLFKLGVEKVILNTAAYENTNLVKEISKEFGSQSVVCCVDVKKSRFGKYSIYIRNGKKKVSSDLLGYISELEEAGAGELILSAIDRDGTRQGYDTTLLRLVSDVTSVPIVAVGGAGDISDFGKAIRDGKVSAVGAGDLFVFNGRHKAVLVTYPSRDNLEEVFKEYL